MGEKGVQVEMGSGVASQKRKQTFAVNANEANLQMVESGLKNENLPYSKFSQSLGPCFEQPWGWCLRLSGRHLSSVCQALGFLPDTYRASHTKLPVTPKYTETAGFFLSSE